MTKPIIDPLNPVTIPFLQQYERYIPTAFDGNLSMLQKVNMVIKALNDVGTLTNSMIDKWNEVYDWVMNEGLSDQVEPILQKWWDEGRFDSYFEGIIEELGMIRNSSFIGNINFQKIHYRPTDGSHTSVWLTDIPYTNIDGSRNELKRGYSADVPLGGSGEKARDFSDRHKASAVFNASTFNVSTLIPDGLQITNGVVVKDEDNTFNWKWYLGIDSSGILKAYPHGTASSLILSEGMKEVVTAFYPIINNGVKVDKSVWDAQGSNSPYDYHVRHVIAQRNNNDYVILTSSGYQDNERGLNMDDIYSILTTYYNDIRLAFNLDGGGSAQSVVYGTMLNRPVDGAETTERIVPDFLYFAKDLICPRDHDIYGAYKMMGYIRKELINVESRDYYNTQNHSGYMQLKAPTGFISQGIEAWEGDTKLTKLLMNGSEIYFWDYVNSKYIMRFLDGDIYTEKGRLGQYYDDAIPCSSLTSDDLNSITRSGSYWATITTANIPDTSGSWEIKHTNVNSDTAIQTATLYASPFTVKHRRKSSGVWGSWE